MRGKVNIRSTLDRESLIEQSGQQGMTSPPARLLGRGGCQVWEGRLKDGRACAVKQVDKAQGQKESELLARITSAGACAHIITYYNFEAAPDGRVFLAMELADQGTL